MSDIDRDWLYWLQNDWGWGLKLNWSVSALGPFATVDVNLSLSLIYLKILALMVAISTSPSSTTFRSRWRYTGCICSILPHGTCWRRSIRCSNSAPWSLWFSSPSGKVSVMSSPGNVSMSVAIMFPFPPHRCWFGHPGEGWSNLTHCGCRRFDHFGWYRIRRLSELLHLHRNAVCSDCPPVCFPVPGKSFCCSLV